MKLNSYEEVETKERIFHKGEVSQLTYICTYATYICILPLVSLSNQRWAIKHLTWTYDLKPYPTEVSQNALNLVGTTT